MDGSVAGDLIETAIVTQSKHGPFERERVKPSNSDDPQVTIKSDDDPPYAVLKFADFAPHLGAAASWAENNIPLLDFPDIDINTTYYYRWRLFKEHVFDVDGMAAVSEWLAGCPDKPQPLTMAKTPPMGDVAAHHVADGQWLRDPKLIDDVLLWWQEKAPETGVPCSGTLYGFTNWVGWVAAQRQWRVGNRTFGARLLNGLVHTYRGYPERYLVNESGRACWWQADSPGDAMEFSISGGGCRPTINAALYGEAQAIVSLAESLGNDTIASEFEVWREFSRRAVLDELWSEELNSFAVVPLPNPSPKLNPSEPFPFVMNSSFGNLTAARAFNETVAVRELLAYMPWLFSTGREPLIPYSDGAKYGVSLRHRGTPCPFL
eukprot:SAG11_NODE_284_length_11240_cov_6.333812_5_plen_377_part_00